MLMENLSAGQISIDEPDELLPKTGSNINETPS